MRLPLRWSLGGYAEYVPPAALAHLSDRVWIHRTPAGIATTTHRVMPDPEVGIAFSCHREADGRPVAPALLLLGGITQARLFTVSAGYEMTAVKLRVECVKNLLDLSPRDVYDAVADLRAVLPRHAGGLFDSLCETRSAADALAVLTAWVANLRVRRPPAGTGSAAQALALIRRSRGRLDVERLADAADLPVRTLRRRVLEAADLSPKSYARMCRFLFAIELMDRRIAASRPEWAALALDAGYCDQSHLVRDFQAICGMTPGAVREERRAEPAVRHETSLVLAEKSNPAAALDR